MNIKTKISAKVVACAMALTAVLPVQGVLAAVTPGSDDFNRAELKVTSVNVPTSNKGKGASIGGDLFKAADWSGAYVNTDEGYIEIKNGGIGKSGGDGYLHMHTGFYPKSETEPTTKNGNAANQLKPVLGIGGTAEKQYFIFRVQMRADDLNAKFGFAHKINNGWYGGLPEMTGGKLSVAGATVNYETGQWYDVVVQYEKGSKTRTAWVNGISVSGTQEFGSEFVSAGSFQVNQYSADYGTTSDFYIDNIEIYESDTSYDPLAESVQNLREDSYNRSFARITKDTETVNIDKWNKGYSGFGTTTSALTLIIPYCGSDSEFLENEYVEPASGKGKQEGDSFVKAHIEPGSGVMKFYGSGSPAANSKTPLVTPMSSEKDTVFELSFYNDASSPNFSFVLKLDNAWRDIGFAVKDNVLSSLKTHVAANVALEQNQWYRAAVVVKAGGVYDIYLDDKKVCENIATNLTAKPTEISAAQISFNRDANNAKDAYFDNFRVYDTASYVPENAEIIASGKYVVNKNTVENILTGTSVEEFIGQLTLSDGAYGRVYASDGTERTEGSVQPGDSLTIYTEYSEKVYNLSVSDVTAVFYKNSVSDENIIYKLDPTAEKTIVKIAFADIDLSKALIAAAAYSGDELKQVKKADGETVEFTDVAECTQIAVYAWDAETMKPLSNRISTEP